MKNRNTKDLGANHIYTFIFSNISLFVAVFFSINSVPQVAAILYSLSLNLLLIWVLYYASAKSKLKYHSQYFNDLTIGMGMLAAFVSAVIFSSIMLLLNDNQSFGALIIFFAFLAYFIHFLIMKAYSWNKVFENKLIDYRMTIEAEKENNRKILLEFLSESDLDKASDYLDTIGLYDSGVDAIIENLRK
ncbi:hypothetical protein DWB61_04165 [Ancylomarina euxinus]|uniref:Uncharacterized protein n=1 Tax=Ancylomarina euxinus TaxID=2283627 RepID=A0A425Y569_9BACT|nr:hypothetical protein [Ancylomarina euxinus]MCZ4694393.1 hypothetical protein [Ancylomarina euxinus]MUP14277.1 hypothetical protein [Ancylomarina euxinus]RRG23595.1 hypothetical protein DWB61_04165 [Ancylomarina euxinus]